MTGCMAEKAACSQTVGLAVQVQWRGPGRDYDGVEGSRRMGRWLSGQREGVGRLGLDQLEAQGWSKVEVGLHSWLVLG